MSESTGQDYENRIETSAGLEAAFDALTTLEGLSAWWTPASGDATAGGELIFSFGADRLAVMHVDVAEPKVGVRWTTTACHVSDWVGTSPQFDLEPLAEGGTAITFRHVGLTTQLECWSDCNSGWNHFISSLRTYLDTGIGNPNGSEADEARREERAEQASVGAA
jgi:Activator of Hsp90 ATPase homolog 1-like protein